MRYAERMAATVNLEGQERRQSCREGCQCAGVPGSTRSLCNKVFKQDHGVMLQEGHCNVEDEGHKGGSIGQASVGNHLVHTHLELDTHTHTHTHATHARTHQSKHELKE